MTIKHSKYQADVLMPDGSHETWLQIGPKSWDVEELDEWKAELQAELDAEPIAGFKGTVLSVKEVRDG